MIIDELVWKLNFVVNFDDRGIDWNKNFEKFRRAVRIVGKTFISLDLGGAIPELIGINIFSLE